MKKHEIVYSYLKTFIQSEKTGNKRLPSENAIATRLHVSRVTVRTATGRLKKEGFIFSSKGSGTYCFPSRKSFPSTTKTPRYLIGILLQGIDLKGNQAMLRGLIEELGRHDISYEVFQTDNTYTEELKCLKACTSNYSALIIDAVHSYFPNPNLDMYSSLIKKGIPILFYNNYYPILSGCPRFIVDEQKASWMLIKSLLENDYRKIGGIFAVDQSQAMAKYQSFIKAINEYGLEFEENHILFFLSKELMNRNKLKRKLATFMKANKNINALVCCNELVYDMINELETAEKPLLCCYDAAPESIEDKLLCSIHPGEEMGRNLGQTIISMIDNGRLPDIPASSRIFSPGIHSLLKKK